MPRTPHPTAGEDIPTTRGLLVAVLGVITNTVTVESFPVVKDSTAFAPQSHHTA